MTIREQIIRDEGKRLTLYQDSLGFNTIGVGRNLDAHGISDEECELMLDNDIARCVGEVKVKLPWSRSLNDARHAVLVNMCFNMGAGGLLGFRKMLAACELGEYELAAKEMMDSRWAGQVGPRAHRLAKQMASGEWVR